MDTAQNYVLHDAVYSKFYIVLINETSPLTSLGVNKLNPSVYFSLLINVTKQHFSSGEKNLADYGVMLPRQQLNK